MDLFASDTKQQANGTDPGDPKADTHHVELAEATEVEKMEVAEPCAQS